jgi:Tol biopolymer transport system component
MTLGIGNTIGPYEITGFIGAGAMGEVYRAKDSRLGRDVAIKVLPAAFSSDPERLRRFDQEARTAGTLNHRNILAIFDVGSHDGMPYVVSELLHGDTLRERLPAGGLPRRKAIEYGVQIARGLAAAHAKGVIHRDLKPENLFVTNDGTVKILDFGLAKLVEPGTGIGGGTDSLVGTMTGVGLIMGTVGYMAPEQARGLPADQASDVFALGCVLYEMVTGVRAFHRASQVDTLAAILNEDPPPFPAPVSTETPALVAVILRCMEKSPGERFESARDLAFALGVVGADGSAAKPTAGATDEHDDGVVAFRRLTFRRGSIQRARFTPDGHAVVYGGAWEGLPVEPFWLHLGNPEGRSIGHPGTDVLSVSSAGELAVCLKRRHLSGFITAGTLARQPMGGGAPRQLLQGVEEADWNPDSSGLAVVRAANGMSRLEYPVGRVLFETTGWLSHPRFARDGRSIAFIHHEYQNNDGGTVTLVDLEGNARALSADWGTIRGLAWSPDGQEVWFSAHPEGAGRNLISVTMDGRARPRLQVPGQLCIQDTFPDGRALLTHSMERQVLMIQTPGEPQARDLSWMDWSLLRDISLDGQWILLVESGEGGGAMGAICLRPTDGSPAVNLGEGNPFQFSPDGAWIVALASTPGYPGGLVLLPTGVGEPRPVPTGALTARFAQWMPDGRSLIIAAGEGDRPPRLYRVDLAGGDPVPAGPDVLVQTPFWISPDGRWIAARAGDRPTMLYPTAGGDAVAIPGLKPDDEVQPWTMESGAVLVATPGEMPARIHRIDLETGARTFFREVAPPDGSGVYSMRGFRFSPDGQTYGYTFTVQFDDMYVVDRIP